MTSTLAGVSVDDVRQVLSVPEEQRIALFSVRTNLLEEANRDIEKHPVAKGIKALREKMWEKARNEKWK